MMNETIKNYVENKLQEVRDGQNPIAILHDVNGYLEAMEASGTITPIEHIDTYYEFSIELVETFNPTVEEEQEAMALIDSWKIMLDSITSRM